MYLTWCMEIWNWIPSRHFSWKITIASPRFSWRGAHFTQRRWFCTVLYVATLFTKAESTILAPQLAEVDSFFKNDLNSASIFLVDLTESKVIFGRQGSFKKQKEKPKLKWRFVKKRTETRNELAKGFPSRRMKLPDYTQNSFRYSAFSCHGRHLIIMKIGLEWSLEPAGLIKMNGWLNSVSRIILNAKWPSSRNLGVPALRVARTNGVEGLQKSGQNVTPGSSTPLIGLPWSRLISIIEQSFDI